MYAALIVAAVGVTAGMASADQNASELSATQSTSSFSSPNNTYGPWNVQTLQYQWQGGNDVPSITVFNRDDSDRPAASHSNALYVDDYHTWSDRFYTYAQASVANGNILPYRMLYVEGDVKLLPSRDFVIALGGAQLQNPDGTSTRYVSVGPTVYDGHMSYQVRFLPSNTNGIGTSATEFVAMYSNIGKDQVTVWLVDGSQPSVLVGFPPSLTTYQRLNEEDVVWKHWVQKNIGFILGGTVGNHFDRFTGANIYNQRSITFGVFYGQAVGLPTIGSPR